MTDFLSGTLTATATTPTGIQNSASQLVLYTTGCGGATFTIPTAAGTVNFFGSGDGGVTWMPLAVTPSSGGTAVTTSSAAAGLWAVNTSAYTHVAVVATAITGGSISASIHTAPVAGRAGGGGGGPGGGGMVPAGSTGIVSPLVTSATSGPATYNSSTGLLSIPNYTAILTFNSVQFVPTAYSTTSTSLISVGQGVSFTPQTAQALVSFVTNVTSTTCYMSVQRTTGSIPAPGAAIPGGDVQVIFFGNGGGTANNYLTGAIYDTGLTPGTPYNYYLAMRVATSGTLNLVAGGRVQISEYHL